MTPLQYALQRESPLQLAGVFPMQTGKFGVASLQPPTDGVQATPPVDDETVALIVPVVAVAVVAVPVVPVAVLDVFVELVPVVALTVLVFEVDDPCVAVVPVPVPPD